MVQNFFVYFLIPMGAAASAAIHNDYDKINSHLLIELPNIEDSGKNFEVASNLLRNSVKAYEKIPEIGKDLFKTRDEISRKKRKNELFSLIESLKKFTALRVNMEGDEACNSANYLAMLAITEDKQFTAQERTRGRVDDIVDSFVKKYNLVCIRLFSRIFTEIYEKTNLVNRYVRRLVTPAIETLLSPNYRSIVAKKRQIESITPEELYNFFVLNYSKFKIRWAKVHHMYRILVDSIPKETLNTNMIYALDRYGYNLSLADDWALKRDYFIQPCKEFYVAFTRIFRNAYNLGVKPGTGGWEPFEEKAFFRSWAEFQVCKLILSRYEPNI